MPTIIRESEYCLILFGSVILIVFPNQVLDLSSYF